RIALPTGIGPAHPAVQWCFVLATNSDAAQTSRELVGHDDFIGVLEYLERIRHVGRARDTAVVTLAFGIIGQPVGEVAIALCQCCGTVRQFSALDDAQPRRY